MRRDVMRSNLRIVNRSLGEFYPLSTVKVVLFISLMTFFYGSLTQHIRNHWYTRLLSTTRNIGLPYMAGEECASDNQYITDNECTALV